MGKRSDTKFEREEILTIETSDRYWIGVERWTVTDDRGTKVLPPSLVKREIPRNPDFTGKAKGMKLEELENVVLRIDEIREAMKAATP